MPLITCPDCNREISDRAPACPHCGLPNPASPPLAAPPPAAPVNVSPKVTTTPTEPPPRETRKSEADEDFDFQWAGYEKRDVSRVPATALIIILILAATLVGVWASGGFGQKKAVPATASAPPPPTVPADSVEIQSVIAKRADVMTIIDTLMKRQAIRSIFPDRQEAHVASDFWALADPNTKRELVITIAQYCKIQDPATAGAVTVISTPGGDKLGEYTVASGVRITGESSSQPRK